MALASKYTVVGPHTTVVEVKYGKIKNTEPRGTTLTEGKSARHRKVCPTCTSGLRSGISRYAFWD